MSDEDDDEPQPVQIDVGDPVAVARRQTESQFRDEQVADFWRRCLADPVGRMVLWGLLMDCHTFEERFSTSPGGMAYPEAAWFAAGEREVGQRMWRTWLGIDPELVMLMHGQHDYLSIKKTPRRTRRRT
jgi:hypothetical protein